MKIINPQEFRLGNYFQWSEFASMGRGVDVITKKNHYQYEDFKHGVELTEEWLLKLGFEKVNEWYSLGGFNLGTDNGKVWYDLELRGISHYLDSIKYVHQLQNLFFALTGEELTIK